MKADFIHTVFIPERFVTALLALVLVGIGGLITGPLGGYAGPFFGRVIDGLLGGVGRRLDRRERRATDLAVRGTILTVIAVVIAMSVGVAAMRICQRYPLAGISEILLLSLTLSGGAVWRVLLRLNRAMKGGKAAKGGYYAIARSTHTDLSTADDFTITRTGMGFAARSFDKGVVAPVFWFVIGGLPGAYLYCALSTLSLYFARDGFTKGFGIVTLAAEKVMGFAPNFIAGILLVLAGLFTPTAGMWRALIGLFRKGKAPYAEGGLPMTAMAWALKVNLGGPVLDRDGRSLQRQWIGPKGATARLERRHLKRGLYISVVAYLLFMGVLAIGVAFAYGFSHLETLDFPAFDRLLSPQIKL